MKKFKEWLSDYLRYILLIIGALLAFTLITFGVQTWLIVKKAGSPQTANTQTEETQDISSKGGAIEILTEKATEAASESQKETQTEKASETELSSEANSEAETDSASAQSSETTAPAENTSGSQTADPSSQAETSGTSGETAAPSDASITPETSAPQTEQVVVQTEILAETQAPEPETEAPYEPVYLTMKGACYIRSYADYGDNIIGEYPAGTVVEFLEDVGGWYKVQVDGMVGYMGARFF